MKRLLITFASLAFSAATAFGQANTTGQTLIEVTGSGPAPAVGDVTVSVDGKKQQLLGWAPATTGGVQIAFLIDDGLSTVVNVELDSLRSFIRELPQGTQVFIGYMRGGEVYQAQAFTTDFQAAAAKIRPVSGSSNASSSAYFSLTKFVSAWPADRNHPAARFVLMLTSGKDQYIGSSGGDSPGNSQGRYTDQGRKYNQKSPYVANAIQDAQLVGVSVSSVYYRDAAGSNAAILLTGQGYLADLSDSTGGHTYSNPNTNTAFLAPFLKQFYTSITQTYVATFPVKANAKGLLDFKADTKAHDVKLRFASQVNPHNVEMTAPIAK